MQVEHKQTRPTRILNLTMEQCENLKDFQDVEEFFKGAWRSPKVF